MLESGFRLPKLAGEGVIVCNEFLNLEQEIMLRVSIVDEAALL